jgi:hypothetical protein
MRLFLVAVLLIVLGCASTREFYMEVGDEIPSYITNITDIDTVSRDVKIIKYRIK